MQIRPFELGGRQVFLTHTAVRCEIFDRKTAQRPVLTGNQSLVPVASPARPGKPRTP